MQTPQGETVTVFGDSDRNRKYRILYFYDTDCAMCKVQSVLLRHMLEQEDFPVEVIAIRNSDASFESHFSEAGINQTRHQLNMTICVDISVLILGKAESFNVCTQVVVAETIIVGHVPDTYLHTGG
jgi:hypothetical protein